MKIQVRHGLFIRSNSSISSRPSIWFIHGFADSGLAYKEAFNSSLVDKFNLFVVDMPGFGVSPHNAYYNSIRTQADLLAILIQEMHHPRERISLVAHSLGGLIGTWVCQILESQIHRYVSVEGNLTEADSYFSSLPLAYETPEEFVHSFEQDIYKKGLKEKRYRKYYSSLNLAHPKAMYDWARTSQPYIQNNLCGFAFKKLKCRKIYLWGDQDTPKTTQDFIQEEQLPNHLFPGKGHWHMSEHPETFYPFIHEFLGV